MNAGEVEVGNGKREGDRPRWVDDNVKTTGLRWMRTAREAREKWNSLKKALNCDITSYYYNDGLMFN